jgi:hypothetical protein
MNKPLVANSHWYGYGTVIKVLVLVLLFITGTFLALKIRYLTKINLPCTVPVPYGNPWDAWCSTVGTVHTYYFTTIHLKHASNGTGYGTLEMI